MKVLIWKLTACATALLMAAACGGSGTAPIEEIDSVADISNELDRLIDASNLVEGTTAAQTPVSTVATYQGIAVFGFAAETSMGEAIGGELEMSVSFRDNTVSGSISNFYARESIGVSLPSQREGALTIGEGPVLRSTTGTGFVAPVTGTLEIVSEVREIDGTLAGAFGGTEAEFMRGDFNVSFENTIEIIPLERISLDGSFVAEAR